MHTAYSETHGPELLQPSDLCVDLVQSPDGKKTLLQLHTRPLLSFSPHAKVLLRNVPEMSQAKMVGYAAHKGQGGQECQCLKVLLNSTRP